MTGGCDCDGGDKRFSGDCKGEVVGSTTTTGGGGGAIGAEDDNNNGTDDDWFWCEDVGGNDVDDDDWVSSGGGCGCWISIQLFVCLKDRELELTTSEVLGADWPVDAAEEVD